MRAILSLLVLVIVAAAMLALSPEPSVESPSPDAPLHPLMSLTQDPPGNEPPFAGLPFEMSWGYSDLVCTGLADRPEHTGKIERIGGIDRDQLSANVELQTCFKGRAPQRSIVVLGDSFMAAKDLNATAFVYAGPPTGFLSTGRNLLFLRETESSAIWRVTVPVYQCAIPLADTPPEYELDGSENSIRAALGAEIMAVIRQGYVHGENEVGSTMAALNEPAAVVGIYANPLAAIVGLARANDELATLLNVPRLAMRRAIAVQLMLSGDERGLAGTIAALQDKSAPDYVRENAARALERTSSISAQAAVEGIAREAIDDPLHRVAREVVAERRQRSR